jgi:hypothetical protein
MSIDLIGGEFTFIHLISLRFYQSITQSGLRQFLSEITPKSIRQHNVPQAILLLIFCRLQLLIICCQYFYVMEKSILNCQVPFLIVVSSKKKI